MSRAGDRHRAKKKRCLALKRWRRWKRRRPNYGPSPLAGAYAQLRALRLISEQISFFRETITLFGSTMDRTDFAWHLTMAEQLEGELERLCRIACPK